MITSRGYACVGITPLYTIQSFLDNEDLVNKSYIRYIDTNSNPYSWTSIQFGFYSYEVDVFIIDDKIAVVNPFIVNQFQNLYKLSLINLFYKNNIKIDYKYVKDTCSLLGENIQSEEEYLESDLYMNTPEYEELIDTFNKSIEYGWLLFGYYYNAKKSDSRYNYLLKSNPISINTNSDFQSAKSAIIKRSWWNYRISYECYDIKDKRYLFVEGRLYWEINKSLLKDKTALEIISYAKQPPIPQEYLKKIKSFKRR